MVYGGTIRPGFAQGKSRDIISAFQSYGEYIAGVITDEQRLDIVKHSCRARARAAGCTPRTRWRRRSKRWACRCRTARRTRLKISVEGGRMPPRGRGGEAAPRARSQVRATSSTKKKSFENALVMVMAGRRDSTNAVLHLISRLARAASRAAGARRLPARERFASRWLAVSETERHLRAGGSAFGRRHACAMMRVPARARVPARRVHDRHRQVRSRRTSPTCRRSRRVHAGDPSDRIGR